MEVNTEGLTPWTGLGNPSNLDTCAVDLQTGEFSFVPPNVLLSPLVAIPLNAASSTPKNPSTFSTTTEKQVDCRLPGYDPRGPYCVE